MASGRERVKVKALAASAKRFCGAQTADDFLFDALVEVGIVLAEAVEDAHHLRVGAVAIVAGVGHGGEVVHRKRTSIGGGQIRYKVHAAFNASPGPIAKLLKIRAVGLREGRKLTAETLIIDGLEFAAGSAI